MKEKRRVGFVAVGIVVFSMQFGPPLWAGNTPPGSDCPSCPAFGVHRFHEKKEAPPFSLKSLNGSPITLSDFRGKPVLLFFWGSWCDACKEDIPLLEKFSEGEKEQLTILTIAVDGERERRIQGIVKKLKMSMPVLLVFKEKVIDTYEIRMVPMAVLINREGLLVGKIVGQRNWSSPVAQSVVKELLF